MKFTEVRYINFLGDLEVEKSKEVFFSRHRNFIKYRMIRFDHDTKVSAEAKERLDRVLEGRYALDTLNGMAYAEFEDDILKFKMTA